VGRPVLLKAGVNKVDFLEGVRSQLAGLVEQHGLSDEEVHIVSARALSPREAIGEPERRDFPLLKGKEVMMQATFRDAAGQAYTDMPGNYSGALKEVLNLPLVDNFRRAVFVATLNAVMRHLRLVDKTVHCRDREPGECAAYLTRYMRDRFGDPRIAFIGLQPAMVESLAANFRVRVTDLDPDNVGRRKCGVMIEDAGHTEEMINWSDLVLATGTTAVNDTLRTVVGKKPVIFYGVTIAGIAQLCGYEQYCYCGH